MGCGLRDGCRSQHNEAISSGVPPPSFIGAGSAHNDTSMTRIATVRTTHRQRLKVPPCLTVPVFCSQYGAACRKRNEEKMREICGLCFQLPAAPRRPSPSPDGWRGGASAGW